MANSKSNIYPIQLQGAELNLNKYDAEIKQYSGFNKNNSPFVGGCLSNIFTKDKVIEGATDDNTIINENGDIYEVDTEGLKKNDEYVINFPENTVFWEREEKKLNDNVIKFYSEAVKIIKEDHDTTWQYKIQGVENTYIAEVEKSAALSDEEMAAYFTGTFLKRNSNLYFIIYCCFAGVFRIVKILVTENNLVYLSSASKDFENVNVISKNTPIIFDSTTNTPNFIICFLNYNYATSILEKTDIIAYTSVKFDLSFISDRYTTLYRTQINPGNYLFSKTIKDYAISSYPINTIIPKSAPTRPIRSDYDSIGDSIYVRGFITKPDVVQISGQLSVNSVDFCELLCSDSFYDVIATTAVAPETVIRGDIYKQGNNVLIGTISKTVNCYDFQIAVKRTVNDDSKYFMLLHFTSTYQRGFQDPQDNPVIGFSFDSSKGKYVLGDFVSYGDTFNFAFNNNAFSAICGKNVLLSNWNEIVEDDLNSFDYSLFWDNGVIKEGLVYRHNKKLFYLKNGKPKIKKFLNQIVCNADCMENSYDIIRNKKLHYASAFNGIYNDYTPQCLLAAPSTNRTSSVLLGTAVNEYSLEDNSSIILNPVSFYATRNWLMGLTQSGVAAVFGFTNDKVDVYISAVNDPNVIYRYTIKGKTLDSLDNQILGINRELVGLPFPIDTNGNVTYTPDLFGNIVSKYGNSAFYQEGDKGYPLNIGNNNEAVFNFYLGNEIEGFEKAFIIQGQYYGIINNNIFSLQYNNGTVNNVNFVVSAENLQFVGNTPYEALFFSKTNRCLYSFTGANILQQKQLVDKISEVRNYLYNPATQTVFLITDIGVLFYGLFGMFLLEYTNISNIFLLDNGIVMSDNNGNYRYIKYYLDEGNTDYTKENINVETSFYGMNNQTVTINDCLYMRLFSEEHEEGEVRISATTISLEGRKTEETVFKYKKSDWDKMTHTIYMRYQPKTQRGLGISFNIESPFKIASMSVGSQADAILVDKVSKGAITAPFNNNSSNIEW